MFEAYKAQIDADITTKTAANSIEPVVVGEGYKDLVDLLAPFIESINDQVYFQGSSVPSDLLGDDLDLYARTQDPLIIYRKESGAWVVKWTIPLSSLTFPDGNFTVKTSLNAGVLTAFAGVWFISNNQYNTAVQTQFNISAANATLETQDLIYADTNSAILFLAGTPGLGQPSLPANCVLIDVVIIPSVASGADPYLRFGNVIGSTELEKTITGFTEANLTPDAGQYYLTPPDGIVLEVKHKITGETKTYRRGVEAVEEDTAWTPNRRIYFASNSPQTITITTI